MKVQQSISTVKLCEILFVEVQDSAAAPSPCWTLGHFNGDFPESPPGGERRGEGPLFPRSFISLRLSHMRFVACAPPASRAPGAM